MELIPRLSLVTAPTAEPLTLAEVKAQVRRDDGVSVDDTLLTRLITAARQRAEEETGRSFLTTTWDLRLDCWPSGPILVPKPPLIGVTSISYVDTAGDTQTWASDQYQVSAPAGPTAAHGRIVPAYGVTYPLLRAQLDAVTVRFTAGYGASAAAVPEPIRHAMLMMISEWYDVSRSGLVVGTIQGELPGAAVALLRGYKAHPLRMAA